MDNLNQSNEIASTLPPVSGMGLAKDVDERSSENFVDPNSLYKITIASELESKWAKFTSLEITQSEIVDLLSNHQVGKKEGTALLQGLPAGPSRTAKGMVANQYIVLDLDSGETEEAIATKIVNAGLECLLYSTHSHLSTKTSIIREHVAKQLQLPAETEFEVEHVQKFLREKRGVRDSILNSLKITEQVRPSDEGTRIVVEHAPIQKFRLVFFLDKPFVFQGLFDQTARIAEWKARYGSFAESLGVHWDASCNDPSRGFYLPRHAKGKEHVVRHFRGKPVNLDDYPIESTPASTSVVTSATGKAKSAVKSADSKFRFHGQPDCFIAKQGDKQIDLLVWEKQYHFRPNAALKEAGYECRKDISEGKASFGCPWEDEHSEKHGTSEGFYAEAFDAPTNSNASGFRMGCRHSHGDEFDRLDYLKALIESGALPFEFLTDPRFAVARYSEELAQKEIEELSSKDKVEAKAIAKRICQSAIDEAVKDGLVADIAAKTKMKKSLLVKAERKEKADTGDLNEQLSGINQKYAITLMNGSRPFIIDLQPAKNEFVCMSLDGWHSWLAPQRYLETSSEGIETLKPVSFAWMQWKDRHEYNGVEFEPSNPTEGYYNLFRGWNAIEPDANGDWSLLKQHMLDVICRGNEVHFNWFMTWLADIVQFPGRKMGSAVAIRGPKGSGKSIVFKILEKILHPYVLVSAHGDHVTGNFNFHLAKTLLLVAEEAVFSANKKEDSPLKNLITSETIMMEKKGVDAISMNNYTRVAMLTNEQRFVNATAGDERRYFVLEATGDKCGDSIYFKSLMEQMEAGGYAGFLSALTVWTPPFDLGWDILRQPPKTKWLAKQVMESMKPEERFFIAAAESGSFGGNSNLQMDEDKDTLLKASDILVEMKEALAATRFRDTEKANNQVMGGFMKRLLMAKLFKRNNIGHYRIPPLRDVRRALAEMGYDLQLFVDEPVDELNGGG